MENQAHANPGAHASFSLDDLASDTAIARAMWRLLADDPLTRFHVCTRDGLIVWASDATCRVLLPQGFPREQLLGRTWHEVFPRAYADERVGVMRSLGRAGETKVMQSMPRGTAVLARYTAGGSVAGVAGGAPLVLICTRTETVRDHAHSTQRIVMPTSGDPGKLGLLSDREVEVLACIGAGMSIPEVAAYLGKSEHTINERRRDIGRKLEVSDRLQLAEIAREAGLAPGRESAHPRGVRTNVAEHIAGLPRVPTAERAARVGGFPTPETLLNEPTFARALVESIVSDPFAGFHIATGEGRVLFGNDRAAQMLVSQTFTIAQCIGRTWVELASDPGAAAQRLVIARDVLRRGKGRVTSAVYFGKQVVARWECAAELGPSWRGVCPEGRAVAILVRAVGGAIRASLNSPVGTGLPAHISKDITSMSNHFAGAINTLSPREAEVLGLIGDGLSNKQIALRLHRSEHTIEDHRKAIGKKLGVDDRVQLAEIAHRAGLGGDAPRA